VEQKDFKDIKPESNNGFIIMNPPYGERMKQSESENLTT
jgi:23S rRNA G2445 N2-methylase RlmL